MKTTYKCVAGFLGLAALGGALLTSSSARANCDVNESAAATQANTPVEAADYCACDPNVPGLNCQSGNYAYLDYLVTFIPITSGSSPEPGHGFGSNQIIEYFSSPSPSTQGYYDTVVLTCANQGQIWPGTLGPFTQNLDAHLGQGGYPPSAYIFCSNLGDPAQKAVGWVYVQP